MVCQQPSLPTHRCEHGIYYVISGAALDCEGGGEPGLAKAWEIRVSLHRNLEDQFPFPFTELDLAQEQQSWSICV